MSAIAIYGLGTETKRFLIENEGKYTIAGLLDGYRTDGEMYGYPIISLQQGVEKGIKLIIVIARPGSCKAIAKRIGDFCRENGIELIDVRGKNLLNITTVAYDFKSINGNSRNELMELITSYDVVSFDLFDTLVMRKVPDYTDVFELLNIKLREKGVVIPDFPRLRLFAEKELSKYDAPHLEKIYRYLLDHTEAVNLSAFDLAEMEWSLDLSLLVVRDAVREVLKTAVLNGKTVVITTDNYYSKEQIKMIMERFDLIGYDDLLVSCDCGTLKTQQLFQILGDRYAGKSVLHIGDDEYADVEKARENGVEAYRIYSATDLLGALGGLGIENEIISLCDRVKLGLFLSRVFNSPFWFEDEDRRLSVADAYDIGYLFCAPMISDFTLWMSERVEEERYDQILFGARDGYLVEKLYNLTYTSKKAFYFHTSRMAAIRAGMQTQSDVDYVDGMKFSGTVEEATQVRFGINVSGIGTDDRTLLILKKARRQRENYWKYMKKVGVEDRRSAFFDFVAKGTTQLYIQKLFTHQIKGFYFLQLEPEFMADKGLEIEPFYSDEEKNTSEIFDNYYILETILTAPYPQMLEMDELGIPLFAEETRSRQDLGCFERAQRGILDYFKEYLEIAPNPTGYCNKKLDEKLLAMVNRVKILDVDFLSLKVEDPFFGRITSIKDVLG